MNQHSIKIYLQSMEISVLTLLWVSFTEAAYTITYHSLSICLNPSSFQTMTPIANIFTF